MATRLIGTDSDDPWLPAVVKAHAVQSKVDDLAGNFTSTDVEGVLAELIDLVDDIVITGGSMPAASTSETIAGTSTTKAVVPAGHAASLDYTNCLKYVVGDGVADDTAAFAAAVAEARAGAGQLYLPPGVVVLTDRVRPLTVTAPLRIYGGGTLRLRTTNTALFQVEDGTARVTLEGVTLDGAGVALTNDTCGVVRCTGTAALHVVACTVIGSARAGVMSYNGSSLLVERCSIHDCAYDGVGSVGPGLVRVLDNHIYNCGAGGVRCKGSTTTTKVYSEGCTIRGNLIADIRDDFAGTGQNGNGVNIYRLMGAAVIGNEIRRVAFSFVRANGADHIAIMGNPCRTAGEVGIFLEFGCSWASVVGNPIDDTVGAGIDMANTEDGATGMLCAGNTVTNFCTGSGARWGIHASSGLVTGNHIDGMGRANAFCAVFVGKGQGTVTSEFRCTVADNEIAGVVYAVAQAISHTSGTKQVWITGTHVVRMDANWLGPFGAYTSGNLPGGNGSAWAASTASATYTADNSFDVPTAQAPLAFMAGSRVRINGVWMESTGAAWASTVIIPKILVRKTTTETVNNSTTMQADDHLTFPIKAGEVWVGEFVLFVAGNATPDIQLDVTAPAGATVVRAGFGPRAADDLLIAEGAVPMVFGMTQTESRFLHVAFSVANGATAGAVGLQWAQSVLTAADTQVLAGSYLIAHQAA